MRAKEVIEGSRTLRTTPPQYIVPRLCPVVGSCGAAREVNNRQYGWMDEMLICSDSSQVLTTHLQPSSAWSNLNQLVHRHQYSPVMHRCGFKDQASTQLRRLGGSAVSESVVGIGAADPQPHLSLTHRGAGHTWLGRACLPACWSRCRSELGPPSAGDH